MVTVPASMVCPANNVTTVGVPHSSTPIRWAAEAARPKDVKLAATSIITAKIGKMTEKGNIFDGIDVTIFLLELAP